SSDSYQIVSADGVDIVEAIENMRKQIGKLLGLSHCYVVVVSDDVCNEYNLATLFDPLVRTERLGTNTILAHTNKKAKDLLLACEEIGGDAQNVLESLTKYNYEYMLNKDASLYDFYKDYLAPHSTGLVVTIDSEEQSATQNSSGRQSQNNDNGSQSENTMPKHKIRNPGKGVAFYNGKKVADVTTDILQGLGWMENSSKFNVIKLENINTQNLHNACVTLKQTDSNLNFKASINNNIPTLYITLNIKAKVVSIKNDDLISTSDLNRYFDESFEQALQNLVYTQCDNACEFQRTNNIDILNFYKIFNTQIHNKWQNYLNTLDNPKEYASKIQVFVNSHLIQVN
ncbi:MAG: hypothetical protein IJU58_01085, partial [Clostridia bacterium]|nr:hypothetical protein [Clostridia bacterium]